MHYKQAKRLNYGVTGYCGPQKVLALLKRCTSLVWIGFIKNRFLEQTPSTKRRHCLARSQAVPSFYFGSAIGKNEFLRSKACSFGAKNSPVPQARSV